MGAYRHPAAMMATLKTQDWVVADGHLDLEVSYAEESAAILRFAWIEGE